MYALLLSAVATIIIAFLDYCRQSKRQIMDYIAIFFMIAGFNFLLKSQEAHASFYPGLYKSQINHIIINTELKEDDKKRILTTLEANKKFLKECREKMDYHFEEACRCLNDAEKACLWLPTTSDQEKALACFANFTTALSSGTPKERALATLLAMFAEYGLAVIREWQYVDSKLQQAKTNFDLEEFYRLSANHAVDLINAEIHTKKEAKKDKK